MNNSKFRLFTIIFCIFNLFLVQGCTRNEDLPPKEATSTLIPVKADFVEKRTLVNTVRIPGHVEPLFSVDIYPGVNGIVTREYITLGDAVEKDQLIAEVLQDIPGMKFTPVRILATVPGTVTADNIEEGDRVQTSRPIYTISQLRQVFLVGHPPETVLARLRKNDIVLVEFEAYPGLKFQGELEEISPVINPQNNTGEIKILIDNSNERFRSGMFGWCNVVTGFRTGLAVPLDAIVTRGEKKYIYRVEYGKVNEIEVETGMIDGEFIEIKGNVEEGDEVILLKPAQVHDGSLVKIVG